MNQGFWQISTCIFIQVPSWFTKSLSLINLTAFQWWTMIYHATIHQNMWDNILYKPQPDQGGRWITVPILDIGSNKIKTELVNWSNQTTTQHILTIPNARTPLKKKNLHFHFISCLLFFPVKKTVQRTCVFFFRCSGENSGLPDFATLRQGLAWKNDKQKTTKKFVTWKQNIAGMKQEHHIHIVIYCICKYIYILVPFLGVANYNYKNMYI